MSETFSASPDSNIPLAEPYSRVGEQYEFHVREVPRLGGLTVRPYLAKLALDTLRTVTEEAAANGGYVRLTYDSITDGGIVGVNLEPPIELLNQTDLARLQADAELAGGHLVQLRDAKNGSERVARVELSFPFHPKESEDPDDQRYSS